MTLRPKGLGRVSVGITLMLSLMSTARHEAIVAGSRETGQSPSNQTGRRG